MLIDKLCLPKLHLNTELTESLLGIVLLYDADYRLDSLCHFSKIDGLDFHRWQAKLFGTLHQMVNMGCSNKRLAGNTPEMETVPAELLFLFHQQGFRAELGSSRRYG